MNNLTKFKVGDQAGVGCMVNRCMKCDSYKSVEEHHCEKGGMAGIYSTPEASSPIGITQGGYASNIVLLRHILQ
jgi:uncharacterized zinc-type alcohol dehydrogenase-like protein